jgi:hypothetical protein
VESKALFCKKCHVFVTRYIQDKDGTQLVKNGHPIGARFSGNFITSINGDSFKGVPVRCQRGHLNVIQDSIEIIIENIRKNYKHGQPCTTHLYKTNAVCNQRKLCEECKAYIDWKEVNG